MEFSNQSRTSRAHHDDRRSDKRREKMNTNLNHGSARIYQFPAGGRSALGGRRYEETKAVTDFASSRVSQAVYGGSWYHEAAIEESKSRDEH
jgi:hypothetical protein